MKNKNSLPYALVRGIPASFDQSIKPENNPQHIDVTLARQQHRRYREILSKFGWTVLFMPPDNRFPDCPFTEDTAVVIGNRALITNPGAESRRGEVKMSYEILRHFLEVDKMSSPATLDGGDVLQIGNKIFVGRSVRTNERGIEVLAEWAGTRHAIVLIPLAEGLHLKSVVNYLGKGVVIVSGKGVDPSFFSGFEVITIDGEEADRLSFLSLGETVILPSDCPETGKIFASRGFIPFPLDISEIRKAQAGLTCMSVLFHA